MIKKPLRILYGAILMAITFFIAGFFTLGVWAIYGRSIAYWALVAVTIVVVALCCAGKD